MRGLACLLTAGTVTALTVQVLGSVVVHVLVALVIILFGPVLFALASPGPADLLNEDEEALHGEKSGCRCFTLVAAAAAVMLHVCMCFTKSRGEIPPERRRKR